MKKILYHWKLLLGRLATGLESQGTGNGRGSTPLASAKLGDGQMVRQQVLILSIGGSSPSPSANVVVAKRRMRRSAKP